MARRTFFLSKYVEKKKKNEREKYVLEYNGFGREKVIENKARAGNGGNFPPPASYVAYI